MIEAPKWVQTAMVIVGVPILFGLAFMVLVLIGTVVKMIVN